MTAVTPHKEWVTQLVKLRLEPNWLRDLRLHALAAFEQAPDLEKEAEAINQRAGHLFAPAHLPSARPDVFPLQAYFQQAATNRVVYNNEKITKHHIAPDLVQQGVLLSDLLLAVRMFPKLVRPHLGQVLPAERNKWVALQTALWTAGLFLYVPQGVRVQVPLQAWWQRTQAGGQIHPRVLVIAEADSEVTLLLGDLSHLEESAFSIQAVEVVAKERAKVQIVSLQQHDAQMTRLAFQQAQVEQGAQVKWLFADVGTGYSVVDSQMVLADRDAEAQYNALFLGAEKQHLDLTLTTVHCAPHTTSAIQARGILFDQARAHTRAISRIDKGAVGTNSRQEERMIVLSKQAQALAVPMLLIAEEEVRCDHALSVGPLRADHLFYLMSRGLAQAEAKQLLLNSFLSPLLDACPLAGLTEMIAKELERKVAP